VIFVSELSRFWQSQFLKEARRGKQPQQPVARTENSDSNQKQPAVKALEENDAQKVTWLPDLIRRRHSASSEEFPEKEPNGIGLSKEDGIVALDMSANIVIQSTKEDGIIEDLEAQISDPEGHLLNPPGEGPGAFPCSSCGKVYRWKRTLRNHLRSECGKEPQFQCPYCHLRSKRKSNIYAHIRVVHQKQV